MRVVTQTRPTSALAPDAEAISEFLTSIEIGVHLCSIVPDGGCRGRWFGGDVTAATQWAVAENKDGRNLYWTVNLVADGCDKKPSKHDILKARFVHVDIDPPKDGGVFDKDLVAAELLGLEFPPSLVIDSGGGLQAFWRLEGSPPLDEVEAVNRGIAERMGGDSCHNIDRLMRLPGSINYPNKKKADAGRIPVLSKVIV